MPKTTTDLNVKHFSRYGEFLTSFELSKHGWNVYSPIYDEYVDIIAHKVTCTKCDSNWELTPELVCQKCHMVVSTTQKNKIRAIKICAKCGHKNQGNVGLCGKCKNKELINRPTCPNEKCDGEIKLARFKCKCGSITYVSKFRTVQVKSSRLEFKNNKPVSYAVDMKPRDLITDKSHFYIWVCIDEKDVAHFLVMTVNDFIRIMGKSMQGISFLKDQDRQHFPYKDFGKWKECLNKFEKLD
jgi:hypothetical protein